MALEDQSLEQHLLCAAMHGAHSATLFLTSRDFTDPRHRVILTTIQDMIRHDRAIDPVSLTHQLRAQAKLDTPGGVGHTYLIWISLLSAQAASAEYWAQELRGITRVRELHRAAAEVVRLTETEEAVAEVGELELALREAVSDLPAAFDTEDEGFDTLGTILSEPDVDTDWLIPGWLARGERAMVVGLEGLIKSTLMRQFAICSAGGLNPWNGQRVADGLRVLFIDGENSRPQSRRAYRWMVPRLARATIAAGWKDRIVHKSVRPGLDLARRDNGWFRETAEKHSPDVIILSPAYKLMRGGDPKDDGDVMGFLDAVDTVMVAQNCSVLIESHAPYGSGTHGREMRPFGSARWLAWPEIGIGYQKDPEFPEVDPKTGRTRRVVATDWRGAREDRDWPTPLVWGSNSQPPWVPADRWEPSVATGYQIPAGEVAA